MNNGAAGEVADEVCFIPNQGVHLDKLRQATSGLPRCQRRVHMPQGPCIFWVLPLNRNYDRDSQSTRTHHPAA